MSNGCLTNSCSLEDLVPGGYPLQTTLEEVSEMQTNDRLAPTTAAHRRRRHLSVYHRALRSAETPQQRAAVAARYRKLFLAGVETPTAQTTEEGTAVEPIQLSFVSADTVRLAS